MIFPSLAFTVFVIALFSWSPAVLSGTKYFVALFNTNLINKLIVFFLINYLDMSSEETWVNHPTPLSMTRLLDQVAEKRSSKNIRRQLNLPQQKMLQNLQIPIELLPLIQQLSNNKKIINSGQCTRHLDFKGN